MNLIFQGRFKLNCGDLHCARGSVDHLNSFFYYGTSLAVPDIIGRNEASLPAYVKLRSPSQPHRFEGSRISRLWRSLAPGRRRRSMICCASTSFPNDRSQSQPLETLTLRCRLISGKPTFFLAGHRSFNVSSLPRRRTTAQQKISSHDTRTRNSLNLTLRPS